MRMHSTMRLRSTALLLPALLLAGCTAQPATPEPARPSATAPPQSADPESAPGADSDVRSTPEPQQPTEACVDVLIVGARGSTEPIDASLVGRPAREIAQRWHGTSRIVQLDYPASLDVFSSAAIGLGALAELLNGEAQRCPEQRSVLIGYSQGALLIGDLLTDPADRRFGAGFSTATPAALERVTAVAMFGNMGFRAAAPFSRGSFDAAHDGITARPRHSIDAYADRILDFCSGADAICQAGTGSIIGHMEYYSNDMPDQAVEFVLARLADAD